MPLIKPCYKCTEQIYVLIRDGLREFIPLTGKVSATPATHAPRVMPIWGLGVSNETDAGNPLLTNSKYS
jgi:hypothetical protein